MTILQYISITPNPMALTLVLCSLLNGILLIYLIHKKITNSAIFWFMLFTFLNVIQPLSFSFIGMSNNAATFNFWLSINDICTIFAAPLIFCFALAFVGKDAYLKKWYLLFPLIVLLYAISVYTWKTDLNLIHNIRYAIHTPWGRMPAQVNGLSGIVGGLYYIVFNTIVIIFLFSHFYFTNKDINKRKQTRLIIIGFLFLTIGAPSMSILSQQIWHVSTTAGIPYIILILDILVFYAFTKYGVRSFNIDSISEKLLPLIPSAVVFLDKNENIVLINASSEKLFGLSKADLLKKSIQDLFPNQEECTRIVNTVIQPLGKTAITQYNDAQILVHTNNTISVDIHATNIKDPQTQEINTVLIFNSIQDIKDKAKQMEADFKQIEEQKSELERINKTMLDREIRMSELKKENEALKNKTKN